MAKASEQFRQSDVTMWGIAALVCAALAVFGSNVSLLVPQSLIGGLHQPRIAGASIETLRQQVTELRGETLRLSSENQQLLSRFTLQERSGNDITRRVGALELSVPNLLEAMPDTMLVDRSLPTASVETTEAIRFDAEGGSVSVRQTPLAPATPLSANQPLPPVLETPAADVAATPSLYGIAIGASVPAEQVEALWADLNLKVGPLLFGMSPLMTEAATGANKRIVVGPITEIAEARDLCERFERVSIPCLPMPYAGTPMGLSP